MHPLTLQVASVCNPVMAISNIHMPRYWLSVLLIIGQCPLAAFLKSLLRYGKHSK